MIMKISLLTRKPLQVHLKPQSVSTYPVLSLLISEGIVITCVLWALRMCCDTVWLINMTPESSPYSKQFHFAALMQTAPQTFSDVTLEANYKEKVPFKLPLNKLLLHCPCKNPLYKQLSTMNPLKQRQTGSRGSAECIITYTVDETEEDCPWKPL